MDGQNRKGLEYPLYIAWLGCSFEVGCAVPQSITIPGWIDLPVVILVVLKEPEIRRLINNDNLITRTQLFFPETIACLISTNKDLAQLQPHQVFQDVLYGFPRLPAHRYRSRILETPLKRCPQ